MRAASFLLDHMVQTAEKAAAKAEVEATLEANAMVETVKPERGAGEPLGNRETR